MPVNYPSFLVTSVKNALLIIVSCGLTSVPLYAAKDDKTIGFADDQVCAAPRISLPKALLDAPDGKLEDQEISLEGDQLDLVNQNEVVMKGNAQVVQGKRGVFADNITYNKESYQATITGNVRYYTEMGDEIKTDSMRLEIDTFIGDTGKAEMRTINREATAKRSTTNYLEDFTPFAPFRNRLSTAAKDDDASAGPRVGNRIYADRIDIEGEDFQRLYNARITRCPDGEDVLIEGKEVELDHGTGVGYAKNVTVKFKGIPILYAPRFSFPLNDERKSGFLAPSIGDDDVSGSIISVPYYLNLNSNYDATIRPTYYSERGLQLFGEFRYLNERGDASLKAEYMPQDDLSNGDDRYAFGLDVKQNYSNGWGMQIDLQDVSDTQYLSDFRNNINLTSTTHLPQTLSLNYSGDLFYMRAKSSKYVAVTSNLTASNPYDRLPQIAFGLRSQDVGPFEFSLAGEYISFDHDEASKLTGTRFSFTPSISMPIEPIYGYLKPKLSYRTISYSLDNVTAGGEDSPSVSAPIFSVDSGLFLEREMTWGNKAMIHTLEPRAMYVYVPEENQDDLPLFDTGSGSVSSYNVLFREERFFGGDRIGDDQHIALGVTSRIIDDETGDERLKASIGQLYYLDDREVGLSASSAADTRDKSDVFAQLNVNLTDELKINTFMRLDAETNDLDKLNLGLAYRSGNRRMLAIDYYKNEESSEDVRLRLDWPLAPRVQLQVDQRYSLKDQESRASSLGLVFDGCCWAFGLKASRWLQSSGEYREGILATLELDGLGKIQTSQ